MSSRVVLLDVDGTLVDSNDAHAQAWVEALAEHGRPVPFDRVRPLIGMGGDKLLPEVTGLDAESPAGKAIGDRRGEVFTSRFMPRLLPTRGARALLERLHAEDLQLVVATSASASEVTGLLDRAGVRDLIAEATSADDAERSKPDPDIVQAALKTSGCRAADAIMIGDTPYDIEAAGRAGVTVVALRCGGHWRDEDFAGAAAIYDDPADLLANLPTSPFARVPARSA